MNLKSLPAQELITATELAVKNERLSTAEVVRHFQEISDRKLYLERGYPSLFEMVTKHFGFCAGSAQRRIHSMRLIRDLPEVEKKIESGELSLTAAASVQSFFYAEKKEKKFYSKAEKLDVVKACVNKSTREVERELIKLNPEREKRESVRYVTEDRLRLSVSISEELNQKLERIKNLLSHQDPNMRTEDLLNRLADMALERLDPVKKAAKVARKIEKAEPINTTKPSNLLPAPEVMGPEFSLPAQEVETTQDIKTPSTTVKPEASKPRTRYIPAHVKRIIWQKNRSKGCEYHDLATGKTCGSNKLLQIDHVKPYAHRGSNEAENLRVLCATHNRFAWEKFKK